MNVYSDPWLIAANEAIIEARDGTDTRAIEAAHEFEWPAVRRARLAAEHGSDAGYKRHKARHEGACEACRVAHNAANQARKARGAA